ncbi:ATP-dependent DNA helicase RecG [Patescibacteria group bacterium]
MAIHLSSPVSDLPGIGAAAIKDLKNLGVICTRDLLFYLPFRYDDFSKKKTISQLHHNDTVTITGTIRTISARPAKNRSRLTLTEALVEDETGAIKILWFNQPYLVKTLKAGSQVSLAGRVDNKFGPTIVSPVHEPAGANINTGRLVPIYGLTGSLTLRRLRQAIKSALSASDELIDWLPEQINQTEKFPSLAQAIKTIHFPDSKTKLFEAVNQLKFSELFLHQLMFAEIRQERKIQTAQAAQISEEFLKSFVAQLPFKLTNSQRQAAWEIIQDLSVPHPMNRLLEGDVGSGKSVVAAMAMAQMAKDKFQSAYLAPTEILAAQQQTATQKFLPDLDIGLLTRSQCRLNSQETDRSDLLELIKKGKVDCLVGTHAVLQDNVEIPKLALVIVDEQHRFGVAQRHALLDTGNQAAPHLLSMTATPIPRSLALTLYGDLELSILNQMPKGRKTIKTGLIFEKEQKQMWSHVLSEIKAGQQVYIVCPLIDPSDKLGAKSVTEVAKELKKSYLKGIRTEVLHGKLKPKDKEEIMSRFKEGKISVLISTTVVEVGVDVPNATVMIITGAERFGLSQLHQLRGRVGRSDLQSYCYLLPDSFSEQTKERLMALVKSANGFELAEKDLELRGPGNIFGNAQSGFPDFKLATPADVELMKKARDWATEILETDSKLDDHPLLADQVKQSFDRVHLE